MPTWKFAPTSRDVAADTSDLAFDLGLSIVDELPVITSTSTTLTYEGSLSIVSPSAVFNLTLKGTGFSTVGSQLSGGTISQLTLTIAGAAHVTVTGLALSGAEFGNLALPDFDSILLLERFLLSGNDNITGTVLDDNLNGHNGRDNITGGLGDDDMNGGGGNDVFLDGRGDDDMLGGAGADRFLFTKTKVQLTGTNFMEDFGGRDVMVLDNDMFKGIGGAGKLDRSAFKNISNSINIDRNDRILYDPSSGAIWFDPDGRGLKPQILFAFVDEGTPLGAGDFQIIN